MTSPVMKYYGRFLLESCTGTSPLIRRTLQHIDENSDGNKDALDRTPLHLAALSNRCDDDEFRRLVESGGNLDSQDFNGDTPLHLVVKSDQPGKIGLLAQANPLVTNKKGDTALHIAAMRQDIQTMRAICATFGSASDIIDYSNQSGDSALHVCARNGDPEGVRLLLEHGADLRCVNRHGDSVLHALATEMVAWSSKATKLLKVYQTIVNSAALWWSKTENIVCPPQHTLKFVHVQRYAVLLLTSYITNKDNLNVVHFATVLGADMLLKEILNTERVYIFAFPDGPYGEPSYHYDVTNLTEETTTHTRGISTVSLASKNPEEPNAMTKILEVGEKTCVDIIASLSDYDTAGHLYAITPIRQLTKNYWTVYKVIYGIAMIVHIVFMFTLSIQSVNIARYPVAAPTNVSSLLNITGAINFQQNHPKYSIAILIYPIIMILFELFYIGSHTKFYFKEMFTKTINRKEKKTDRFCATLYKTRNNVESVGLFIFDVLPHLAGLALPLSLFFAYFYNVMSNPLQIYFIMAAIVIGWLQVMSFTRGFKVLHSFYVLYKYIIVRDIFLFAVIYTFVLLAFTFANHLVFSTVPEIRGLFPSVFDSLFFTFNVMLEPNFLDKSYDDAFRRASINPIVVKVSYLLYISLSCVIFLSVLIAMMTSTYHSVQKKQQKLWRIFTLVKGVRRERKIPILRCLVKRAKKPSVDLYFEDILSPFHPESGCLMKRCMAVLHNEDMREKGKWI